MKNKKKKFLLLIALLTFYILHFTLLSPLTSSLLPKTLAQDKGVRLSPAFIEFEVKKGETVSDKIEIEYINFSNAQVEVLYKEFNPEYTISEDSAILKNSSKVSLNPQENKSSANFEITTDQMIDKTYFFGYEFKFNNIKSSTSISEKISVIVPIILTVNDDETTQNPKPQILIDRGENIYFNANEIRVATQITNPSTKLINFSGEVIFATEDNQIFYSEKVSGKDDKLFPKQIVEGNIIPDFSTVNKQFIPYVGKVKVFYRGVINNERHIQTNTVEFYLIPLQLIYIIISILMITLIASMLVAIRIRRSHRKLKKELGIKSKEKIDIKVDRYKL